MENNKEYQKWLDEVRRYGVLILVPEEFKTKEICEIAVEKHGDNLQYVPEHLKSPELCKLAISEDGWALEYVPDKYKTPELCEIAVSNLGWALEFVPEEFKTLELCKYAIEDCLKWNDNLLRKYEFENLFEKYVPVEVQEELAEKYDIKLPEKTNERGR